MCRAPWMVGRAMFTTVTSMMNMTAAVRMTARVRVRPGDARRASRRTGRSTVRCAIDMLPPGCHNRGGSLRITSGAFLRLSPVYGGWLRLSTCAGYDDEYDRDAGPGSAPDARRRAPELRAAA